MENLAVTTATTNLPHLKTVKEVAHIFRTHDTTIIRWIKLGALEAIRLPNGTYRIKQKTLDKMLGE